MMFRIINYISTICSCHSNISFCSAPGSPDEVERVAEEGERGGHAEDGHAEPTGWSQNGSGPTRKSFVRYERYQDKVSFVVITYSVTLIPLPCLY